MRRVGHLEEFDPKNDIMAAYIERATFYIEANNVAEDKKTATFLTILGKNTFQVLAPALTVVVIPATRRQLCSNLTLGLVLLKILLFYRLNINHIYRKDIIMKTKKGNDNT